MRQRRKPASGSCYRPPKCTKDKYLPVCPPLSPPSPLTLWNIPLPTFILEANFSHSSTRAFSESPLPERFAEGSSPPMCLPTGMKKDQSIAQWRPTILSNIKIPQKVSGGEGIDAYYFTSRVIHQVNDNRSFSLPRESIAVCVTGGTMPASTRAICRTSEILVYNYVGSGDSWLVLPK